MHEEEDLGGIEEKEEVHEYRGISKTELKKYHDSLKKRWSMDKQQKLHSLSFALWLCSGTHYLNYTLGMAVHTIDAYEKVEKVREISRKHDDDSSQIEVVSVENANKIIGGINVPDERTGK